jgi:hypothetical protein
MITLTRLPDWQLYLDDLVHSRLRRPFVWGSNDCALFAADAVRAITGVDLADGLRNHHTALQAARALRRRGGIHAIAASKMGEPREAHDARPGDVVMIDGAGGHALAVCVGSLYLLPGPEGLQSGPMSSALKTWRVG